MVNYLFVFCPCFCERLLVLASTPSFATSFIPAYTVVPAQQAVYNSAAPKPPLQTASGQVQPPVPLPVLLTQTPTANVSASNTLPLASNETLPDKPLLQRSKLRYKTFAQKHPRWNNVLLATGALALFVAIPVLVQSTFTNLAHLLMRRSARSLDKMPWVNGALSKAHDAFAPKTLVGLAGRIALMTTTLWSAGKLLSAKETDAADLPNQWWWLPSDTKEAKTTLPAMPPATPLRVEAPRSYTSAPNS